MNGCQWIEWSIIQGVMVCVIYGAQVIAQLMLFILLLLQCHYCWTNHVSTDRLAASYSLKYLCTYLLPVKNPCTGLFNWRAVKSNASEWVGFLSWTIHIHHLCYKWCHSSKPTSYILLRCLKCLVGAVNQLLAIHFSPFITSRPPCTEFTSNFPRRPLSESIKLLYHIMAVPFLGVRTKLEEWQLMLRFNSTASGFIFWKYDCNMTYAYHQIPTRTKEIRVKKKIKKGRIGSKIRVECFDN